ncbi:MAG: recombinase family protein [Clostridiales bacterium]|nr:recombinase family protein [Clostridiales bacterium]
MDKIAIYLRLSSEDSEDKDESGSISSQRDLIMDYIQQDSGLLAMEIAEFCDDGCSGTSMDRPGMEKLLKEVKENRIKCVIVKDMSRFSRDYIELGTYMNRIFPFMGIRFIAINDHYDSKEQKGSTIEIDTAFQTLLYDLYSKDVSVKVKAAFENKCVNGEYVCGQVPFGYEKSREKKNAVVVSEKEAEVVRYIFALALEGNGSTQIARILNGKQIPTRMQMRFPGRAEKSGRIPAWSSTSVRDILNNRFYLGEMAYGKSRRRHVGSKNGIAIPKDQWKVIENHHEPLITPEVYKKVCSFGAERSTKRKREKNALVGKLFCGGCGYSMSYKPLREKNKYRRFECRKHAVLQISGCCTCFSADLLEEMVTAMLHIELLLRGSAVRQKEGLVSFRKSCMKRLERKAADCRYRQKQLQAEKDDLYERYALGEVSLIAYKAQADSLTEQISRFSADEDGFRSELAAVQEEYRKTEEDMKQIIRYAHLETLTQEMVDTFVKKIHVYKNRKVEIEWSFSDDRGQSPADLT